MQKVHKRCNAIPVLVCLSASYRLMGTFPLGMFWYKQLEFRSGFSADLDLEFSQLFNNTVHSKSCAIITFKLSGFAFCQEILLQQTKVTVILKQKVMVSVNGT